MVAAAHPPIGGKAPGIDPRDVFSQVTLFIGVYIKTYINAVNNDKNPVRRFVFTNKITVPTITVIIPNISAF